eukprot:1885488-Karenia_brevis.AAC.1
MVIKHIRLRKQCMLGVMNPYGGEGPPKQAEEDILQRFNAEKESPFVVLNIYATRSDFRLEAREAMDR